MDGHMCGICLDQLRVPVCTPCGHLFCEACLTSYIEASADLNESCPTCRAPFSIAIPDLRFVPKKYHSLTSGVRRVFISTDADGTRVHPDDAGLRAQIASLIEKVSGLERDKMLLMDRCEAAIRASHAHAQGERDERLEKERLERENRELNRKHDLEMRELRKKYECVKGKYKALKAVQENAALEPFALAIKRKARSDSSANASDIVDMSQDMHDEGRDTLHHRDRAAAPVFDRPMLRIPKRPRLLGSPFDLAKRIETRRTKSRRLIDADEEGDMRDSDFDASLNLNMSGASASSSGSGPQRSGLPTGDVFSPGTAADDGGTGEHQL
ncbi:hypothetical protein C8Q74DRAFT_566325 [Fomes fomentarius]|nr:hypothetical protein C8Q74DRAFT_566325 [Fomes fomentarius]